MLLLAAGLGPLLPPPPPLVPTSLPLPRGTPAVEAPVVPPSPVEWRGPSLTPGRVTGASGTSPAAGQTGDPRSPTAGEPTAPSALPALRDAPPPLIFPGPQPPGSAPR